MSEGPAASSGPLREALSLTLAKMLCDSAGPVTIRQAFDALGDRSFGGAMLVLALPAFVLPPGVSAVLGAPLLVVCAQLLLFHPAPWLPDVVARQSLQRNRAERVLSQAIPLLIRAESWTRPRLPRLLFPLHERIIALVCMAMSVVLIIPMPFAHTAAALSVSAFGVGLMERDGLALILGWLLVAACGALAFALLAGVAAGVRAI